MAVIPPPPAFWTAVGPALPAFARRVNFVMRATGADAFSWYRDPIANAFAGGAACSQHTWGLAADLSHPASVQPLVFRAARAVGLIPVLGGPMGVSRTATHVQLLNAGRLAEARLCFPRPTIA